MRKSFVKTKKSKRLDFGFRREIISGPPMLKKKFRKHFRAFVPLLKTLFNFNLLSIWEQA